MKSKKSKMMFAAVAAGIMSFGCPVSTMAQPPGPGGSGGGGTTTVSFTSTVECQGDQTTFNSTSVAGSGTIVEWNWDFNNDTVYTEASGSTVNFTLPGYGTFTVGLQVITDLNDTTIGYQNVTVYPSAVAGFTATSECQGTPITLTSTSTVPSGSIVSQNWDLDFDGNYDNASGTTVTHDFGAAGTYMVGIEVVTDNGCVKEYSSSVTVHPNPTADFTFTDVCIGDSTKLIGIGTVATGSIVSYEWDLDEDGMFDDATGDHVPYLFTSPGTYNISLRVTTDNGCQATATHTATVSPLPVILFDFNGACEGKSIGFINNSINQVGTISYVWDFGDGETSDAVNPAHSYPGPGTYTVELTGSNSYGCESSTTRDITIYAAPIAGFTSTDVCYGDETVFTNTTSSNGTAVAAYFWDFGDNEGASIINPAHTYDAPGTYAVQLIVSSVNGCMDTAEGFVNVWELPSPNIMSSTGQLSFCDGDSISLSVELANDENVLWSTAETTTTITVKESGSYFAVVTDSHGCTGSDGKEVVVNPLPTLVISNDTAVSLGYDVPLWATGAVEYEWSPETYLDEHHGSPVTATPLETITYTVTGTSEYGCVSTASVTITVDPDYTFEATNVITPNGNGQNDLWYVKNLDLYDDCDIVIVNRWGNEVYASRGYTTPWDGTLDGEPLPEGTYYYVVKCDGTEKVYKGPITLLRLNE